MDNEYKDKSNPMYGTNQGRLKKQYSMPASGPKEPKSKVSSTRNAIQQLADNREQRR